MNELDVVELAVDVPEEGVKAGEVGTIVLVHGNPVEAYEVEFVNPDGSTLAMFALRPEQIRPVAKPAN
ncbi:DUF4926 domain-containing protein [Glycomyces buryatensis]|uniref:DUF4926 domain-containing protein n=1 Tax=Glycomyces buryatensis TaxID=2570927 RepID=A0A4S8Q0L8_9ACTN|nr:DUF4926 domain-containing protein [Glycomyces buryatensis]THV33614.1 DUF4926 domain-containing protein [Glycomyces buryatensis]